MGKKSADVPPMDPRMLAAIEKQGFQADEMIAFVKSSYADNQVRQGNLDTLNERNINQNMALSRKAGERADDAYSFYQNKGRPLVEKAFEDASNFDSAEELGKARGRASAGAQQQFDSAQTQNNRLLQRMGVNPNSGKFAALNNQMAIQKAAGMAGAANNADEGRRTAAVGMRQQASNLAQGMPATSMGFSGQSSGFGGAASGIAAGGMNSALSTQNAAMSGMNSAGNMQGNVANNYNSVYQSQLQGAQMQNSADQSMWGGIGQLAGTAMSVTGYANGGVVKGPGTGTSDSVPAVNQDNGQPIRLSNGEFVVPADVVATKGKEFFQKLIDKHHKPVNVGRGV